MKYSITALYVLLFGLFPLLAFGYTSNQSADVVVGQANTTSNASAVANNRFAGPLHAYSNGTKLFVADHINNRVVIFNTIPIANNAIADVVIGQADMTSSGINGLYNPFSVITHGANLFIVDYRRNRVLGYNPIPTVNNASPGWAVGQINTTNTSSGSGANQLNQPAFSCTDGTRLFVSDILNNRVLIYNPIPTASNASAVVAVGQPNLTSSGSGCAANRLNAPSGVCTAGGKLIVVDINNNRVLIFNSIPAASDASANVVIGQSGMSANSSGCSATKLNAPTDVYVDESMRLFITDSGNNRVLIYNSIPTVSNAAADQVIGQANLTSNASGCTAATFTNPRGISGDAKRLFVADYGNNRVLIYNDSLQVNNISPAQGITNQTVSVTVSGGSFASDITVKLSNGVVDLTATNLNIINSASVTCSFSLNTSPDTFDLKVERPGFSTVVLADAFAILPVPTATPSPAATPIPTATSSATPIPSINSDFEGQIISKNYIYAAPNPIRGSTARIHVICKQRATGKIKIFTLLGQEVLSIERSFQVGNNVENIYMGNLANAMYYLYVRVRNDEGLEESAKTKIGLLK